MKKIEQTLAEAIAYHKGWKDGFAAAAKIWKDAMTKATKTVRP